MNLMKGIKHGRKAGQEYESVEDQRDLRIPVQNEDAFKHGIIYKAKYIGTQEITRPSSRVEIVSAMRRIRYEYKYRNIKKKKVNMDISVEGIKVSRWKKKKFIDEGKYDTSQLFVMCYPINRVFYVSHDSQDLLIFSFIARGEDGIFRCSVFKAFKKSQAMNIVRTIGQAFEVCHKLNVEKANEEQEVENKETVKDVTTEDETNIDEYGETDIDDTAAEIEQGQIANKDNSGTLVTDIDKAGEGTNIGPVKQNEMMNGEIGISKDGSHMQLQQFYMQQLRLHKYEADAAKAEVHMLKQQLKIESDTRRSAQARTEQLLSQNRELLATVQKLMVQAQRLGAKDVFDPVDDSWTSPPVPDSFFPTIDAQPPKEVTNECITGVYGNVHHQSIDFESAGITTKRPGGSNNLKRPQLKNAVAETSTRGKQEKQDEDPSGSFSDLRKGEKSTQNEGTFESAGEKIGGISSSLNDLTKIGNKGSAVDLNHNADRITKFSPKEELKGENDDAKLSSSLPGSLGEIPGKITETSGLSKEMAETFSQELDELKERKENGTEVFKTKPSSVTDL